jgi:hypothetical protein
MEKLVKRTIFKLTYTPCYRRPLEPLYVEMTFGGAQKKVFGPFFQEYEAMAALLHKLSAINEIALMDVVTSVEIIFGGENE